MIRNRYGIAIRRARLLKRIIGKVHAENKVKIKNGYAAFKMLLFDAQGNKIAAKPKKGGVKDGKGRYKKEDQAKTTKV
jgi:hypothetical protein